MDKQDNQQQPSDQEQDSSIFQSDPYSPIKTPDNIPTNLFILPLRNIIIFPGMMFPVVVLKENLIETVRSSHSQTPYIGLIARKKTDHEDVLPQDLYEMGIVAKIHKIINLPEGGISLVVQGLKKMKVERYIRTTPHLIAKVRYIDDIIQDDDETKALFRNVQNLLKEIISLNRDISEDMNLVLANMTSPQVLTDFIASHFKMKLFDRQDLLETLDVKERLKKISLVLSKELNLLKLGDKIQRQINKKIEKSQKEFFLREQLKAIRKELGEGKDEKSLDIDRFEQELKNLPEYAKKGIEEEIKRMKLMMPESAEYHVIRNYIESILKLPWTKTTTDNSNIDHAEKILNRDHYGLERVKERILEFMAVRQLKPKGHGPILCFVGPPGVGKTSLGKSIAESLGRKFYRLSLGGMRDEAEIKGHRRTYIGAMPGRIMQGIKISATNNPVFMLDEVDKVVSSYQGDPAAALLEALDPEQNGEFLDHYLDIPFDLSKVMFICTANVLSTIPSALLDRMEVIDLPGYIPEEKIEIAKKYLLPKQIDENGIQPKNISINTETIKDIIMHYTQEAGVRNLNREIGRICRKIATRIARESNSKLCVEVNEKNLDKFLGPPKVFDEIVRRVQSPGVAVGLAWTSYGGEILFIESAKMPGSKSLETTGQLGEVMEESTKIALSYIRSHCSTFKLKKMPLKDIDIHIHFPAGATPKDGPSAGIAVATSLLSLFKNKPMKPRWAMTGELTLTGRVLPVGGIKEKVVAAKRSGIRDIILPERNKKDLDEIPKHVLKGLTFHFAETYPQVYELAFSKGRV
ncbi:MAG: endopeptidase La [Deltaproteobacteria bacterium]|nr:endopeptidase La [Deltaproteobacteria bacterium]